MKKHLIIFLITLVSVATVNGQSRWNMGIQNGCATNISKFDAGNETANALFENYPTKSFGLSVNFKYKISEKFSFQTGLGISQIGFTYGMLEDYSLLKPWERSEDIEAVTCMATIPAMVLMNTPLNCNNIRFVFGAGVAVRGVNNNWDQDEITEITPDEGGNLQSTFMSAESKTTAAISPSVTWQIGVEKVLRKGNSISFVYTGNQGLTTIAESTVNYTASNKDYSHTFINRGSFVNFAIAYNFMSFGSRKALKAAQ